jgi:hypothetical protein
MEEKEEELLKLSVRDNFFRIKIQPTSFSHLTTNGGNLLHEYYSFKVDEIKTNSAEVTKRMK